MRILAPNLAWPRAMGTSAGPVSEDWSFELTGTTASSRAVRVSGLPTGWVLKAVYAAADDVTDAPSEIAGTRNVAGQS